MKYIVDRIEGNLAVCEGENLTVSIISLEDLPDGTHEGSVVIFRNGLYFFDNNEEQARKEKLLSLQDGIFDE